jgi:hypothetical protein
MAKKSSPQDAVELYIDGPEITADRFTRSVRTFFDLIKDVSADVGGKRSLEWIVSLKSGSIRICATAKPVKGDRSLVRQTIRAINRGITTIEGRKGRLEHFSDGALQKLFQLGSIVGLGDQGVSVIRIGGQSISPATVAYVDELLGTPAKAYGTIEGKLFALNTKGRLTFSITETLTGKDVRCYFSDNIFDEVVAAIRRRVSAYGLIRYKKSGQPASVEMEKLTVFPDQSDLPQFRDITGLLRERNA